MKFKIEVSRLWSEYGEIIVDAEDEIEASDMVYDRENWDDGEIDWGDMQLDGMVVENVIKIKGKK